MELAKRTVPLELPPFQPPTGYSVSEDMKKRQARQEEKARAERKLAQQKQRALEDAFASSDEEDQASHCSSEWGDEQQPLYNDNDSNSDEED